MLAAKLFVSAPTERCSQFKNYLDEFNKFHLSKSKVSSFATIKPYFTVTQPTTSDGQTSHEWSQLQARVANEGLHEVS